MRRRVFAQRSCGLAAHESAYGQRLRSLEYRPAVTRDIVVVMILLSQIELRVCRHLCYTIGLIVANVEGKLGFEKLNGSHSNLASIPGYSANLFWMA